MTSTTSPPVPGTPAGPARPVRWQPSHRWYRRILWANLVGQIVIVVTGGAVRLTGSGLGCSTWPECEPGQFTPVLHEATTWHPLIEFGNRTLTGVLGVLALAVAWTVWRDRSRSSGYRRLGLVPLLGVVVQAVVGGLTVLVDLHPAWVGGHFLISMGLVAASTALLVRHREGDGPPVPAVPVTVRRLGAALVPLAVVVLGLGVVVTGSGPHSGDLERASRFALDPAEISRLHSSSVWVYLAVLVALTVVVHRTRAEPVARRTAVVLLAVALAQGLLGYVQYLTDLPPVLVGTHMLGAAVLVVAQTRQTMSMRVRTSPADERGRADLRGPDSSPA